MQFYLLLIAAALCSQARSPRFWLGLIGIALLTRIVAVELNWGWVRIYNFTPSRLDAFAAGALVALRPTWFNRFVCLLGLTILFVPAFLGWDRHEVWIELIGYPWVALAAAALIRLSLDRPAASHEHRSPFAFMGHISYAVYLTHSPIRSLVRDIAFTAPRELTTYSNWVRWLAYISIVFSIASLIGWLTWRFIERPAQRYILARFFERAPKDPASRCS